jgi:very-short-patch-repair endonuclease
MRKGDMLTTVMLDLNDLSPVTEYQFATSIQRRWRFDVALLEPRIAIELDGGTWTMQPSHSGGAGHMRDCEKRNAALTLGWRVLTYNGVMVERGDVRRDVDALMEAG